MSASVNIIKASKFTDIDITTISIGKKHDNKAKISINGNHIVIQTPYLEVYKIRSQPNGIFEVFTLFKGDKKKKIDQWYKFIEDYELNVLKKIKETNHSWFTENNVSYKDLIREEDGVFFMKWIINSNTTSCINQQEHQVPLLNLREKDKIQSIVDLSYLWINGHQFGTAPTVQRMRVKEYIEPILSEYVFDDSNSDSDNEDDNEDELDKDMISLMATEQKKNPEKKLETKKLTNLNSEKHTNSLTQKKTPKNPTKDYTKEQSKDHMKHLHKDLVRDLSKDFPKDLSKDHMKNVNGHLPKTRAQQLSNVFRNFSYDDNDDDDDDITGVSIPDIQEDDIFN